MPNMNYCRFGNTANDLEDCYEHMEDSVEELSEFEKKARTKLIDLCIDIAFDYGEKE